MAPTTSPPPYTGVAPDLVQAFREFGVTECFLRYVARLSAEEQHECLWRIAQNYDFLEDRRLTRLEERGLGAYDRAMAKRASPAQPWGLVIFFLGLAIINAMNWWRHAHS